MSSRSSRAAKGATPAASAASARAPLATTLRSATCGELTAANAGQRVVLTGWVARRRDYGQLIFIDLRDRYGITQIVFDPERSPESAAAHAVAKEARAEYVLRVEGVVAKRLEGKENPNLSTGAIEVEAHAADGAEHREGAALPDHRPRDGGRGAAPALSLPGPAPRLDAREH